jgi:hypothetical protein
VPDWLDRNSLRPWCKTFLPEILQNFLKIGSQFARSF